MSPICSLPDQPPSAHASQGRYYDTEALPWVKDFPMATASDAQEFYDAVSALPDGTTVALASVGKRIDACCSSPQCGSPVVDPSSRCDEALALLGAPSKVSVGSDGAYVLIGMKGIRRSERGARLVPVRGARTG